MVVVRPGEVHRHMPYSALRHPAEPGRPDVPNLGTACRSGNRPVRSVVRRPMQPSRLVRTRRTALTLSIVGMVLGQSGVVLAQSPEPTVDPDSAKVVLRMEVGGGFVPMSVALLEMPTFTLYADGSAIFRPSTGGTFDAPPALVRAELSDEQVAALLAYAAGPGGLADAAERYDDMFVSDAPTTVFTIDTPELSKTVSVYALGFEQPAGSPDAEILGRLATLAGTLGAFEQQVEAGNVESAALYEPLSYLATLVPDYEGNTATPELWPWDVAIPALPADGSPVQLVLTPEQVAQVTTVPSGGVSDLYFEGPADQRVLVSIRPLLPDEPMPVDIA